MKPSLLILAAGVGTRFGGLKQIDPIGPHGETVIDYSIYDAIRAGFGKIVFVIRQCFEQAFRRKVGGAFDGLVETVYVYQEMSTETGDFRPPAAREKPWGTGHAVLVARTAIQEPFAVINADDHYGIDAFTVMRDFLQADVSSTEYAMVGYALRDTLSEHGRVSRGICHRRDGYLRDIIERTAIEREGHSARYIDEAGVAHALTGDEIVSMNLWGFHPSMFEHLSQGFAQFLDERGYEPQAEMYLPCVVDELIKDQRITVKVLRAGSTWFGTTYRADRVMAQQRIAELVDAGVYPRKLWHE